MKRVTGACGGRHPVDERLDDQRLHSGGTQRTVAAFPQSSVLFSRRSLRGCPDGHCEEAAATPGLAPPIMLATEPVRALDAVRCCSI